MSSSDKMTSSDVKTNDSSDMSSSDVSFSEGKHAEDSPHGDFVEEYDLLRVLGRGHFATVRLARRRGTGAACALKMIELQRTSQRQKELFRREVAAMMAVKHDNVLDLRRVVQAAQFAGTQMLLLELELCAGGELFDYIIFGGAFPEPIAKHYFKQLMSAMIACHEKGVYHRDLKPENILLTGEPYYALKVADFGLAAVVDNVVDDDDMMLDGSGGGGSGARTLHTGCGTKAYQAPEVLNVPPGQMREYEGDKVDVWSAGVVLFITLLGNPPFEVAGTIKGRLDWWYNACRLNRHGDFWAAHQRPPCPRVNAAPQDFITRIFQVDPSRRATFRELVHDPWIADQRTNCDPVYAAGFMRDRLQGAEQAKRAEKERARAMARASGGREAHFRVSVSRSVSSAGSEAAAESEALPPVLDERAADAAVLFAGAKRLYAAMEPETLFEILQKVCDSPPSRLIGKVDSTAFRMEMQVQEDADGGDDDAFRVAFQLWHLPEMEDQGVVLLEATRATGESCTPWDLDQEWKEVLGHLNTYSVPGAKEALDAAEGASGSPVSPSGATKAGFAGLRRALPPPKDIVLSEGVASEAKMESGETKFSDEFQHDAF